MKSSRKDSNLTKRATVRCAICEVDAAFLRSVRPPYEALRPRIRVVDLFSGCGAMTLGVAESARRIGRGIDVRLAVDVDETANEVFKANFPEAIVAAVRIETLFDGRLGARLTANEMRVKKIVGVVDVLVGGPPCQGHSDLNNHTRRADPRNALYARMARAAEVLRPTVILIENVPTVMHDVEKVVAATIKRLRACGYAVSEAVIDISKLGAPQRRRRHVVLASRNKHVDVERLLAETGRRCSGHPARSVEWAIGDLVDIKNNTIFDTSTTPSQRNIKRIAWLFDSKKYDLPNRMRPKCHRSDHSYRSMYGRLNSTLPAQTVTTGFGSMGQGRYVHPTKRRTITPHEAARLQMLPDFWDFSRVTRRRDLARLIGNAVPPVLSSSLLEPALRSLGLGPPLRFPERSSNESVRKIRRIRSSRKRPAKRARTPEPTSTHVRNRMLAVRQSGTAAELLLRAELDRLGLEYQVDAPIPGSRCRADLLFQNCGVVVFVDGCFWHGCPSHATYAKSNVEWWRKKLAGNRERDERINRQLHDLGWISLRFWEHENPRLAAKSVALMIASRRRSHGRDAPL